MSGGLLSLGLTLRRRLLPVPIPSSALPPIQLLDLRAQHAPIENELNGALQQTLAEAAFIQGPAVGKFAEELSGYLGGPYVVPCANGTDALQLAFMSLKLPAGTEIIVPAFTYVATLEAAAVLGLVPVPAEVQADTFNLDPAAVKAALTPRTGAIVAVHLFGQCADLAALRSLADEHGVALIEDNAQAIGATFTASGATWVAGTVGEVGTCSFFPSKNLGALGDGGALFTRDETRAIYLRQLANHGQTRKYHHEHVGLNSRLDTLQAALLSVKLRHLPQWTAARQQVAAHYDAALAGIAGLRIPARDPRSTHVFHQYTLTLEEDSPVASFNRRNQLQAYLKQHGIPSAIYYPLPNHLQPAYHYLGYQTGQFPVAERLCRTVLSLPIHPMLTSEQVAYVSEAVQSFFRSSL